MMIYRVLYLKDTSSNGIIDLEESIRGFKVHLQKEDIETFGIFHGLFGLASNELYWVIMSSKNIADPTVSIAGQLGGSIELVNITHLEPTVRPVTHELRTEPGIYVFRWFKVNNKDVDEIAALSNKAWETFEAGFDTAVQGLFAEVDRSAEKGVMLLITWYRNLTVWQDSRQPADEARQLFRKRHQLTLEARPVATRLMP